MQRKYRIRKNGQFQYVYRKGQGCATLRMSLHFVKAGRLEAGFSVSKKVGNAVTRNLVKRRLRECFRLLIPRLKRGFYVFSARPAAAESDYRRLEKDMLKLLDRKKLFKEDE